MLNKLVDREAPTDGEVILTYEAGAAYTFIHLDLAGAAKTVAVISEWIAEQTEA
jgi:hypothetical protein